jgi:hypothetical protein
LGRKRFLSAVVLLASAARYGARATLVQALQRAYGISRSTLARWQRWWREAVPQTTFWVVAKTRVAPPIDPRRIPVELMQRFEATSAMEKLIAVLRFIAMVPYDLAVANVHDIRGSRGARRVWFCIVRSPRRNALWVRKPRQMPSWTEPTDRNRHIVIIVDGQATTPSRSQDGAGRWDFMRQRPSNIVIIGPSNSVTTLNGTVLDLIP